MKVAILTLALVALAASVAYAAPSDNEEAEIEAFINELMNEQKATKQENNNAEIEEEEDDGGDNELAALQEFIALEQDLSKAAKTQGWRIRRAIRKVGRFVKKHGSRIVKYGRKYGPTILKYGSKLGW